MKPERLLPLTLLVVGAVVFWLAYSKKTEQIEVPPEYAGNRAVELFYGHGCVQCHTVSFLPHARGVLGPGLDNVGNRSKEYDPGGNGKAYLRESILEPSKVVREGFVNGMPSFRDKLTDQELETLVDWLSTLKTEQGKGT